MKTWALNTVIGTLTITLFCLFTALSTAAAAVPLLALNSSAAASESNAETTLAPEEVNRHVASMSDEEVRRLLLQELQNKHGEIDTTPLEPTIAGPGEMFGDILNALSRKSDSSGAQTKSLLSHLPEVIPDLYRVFLTL